MSTMPKFTKCVIASFSLLGLFFVYSCTTNRYFISHFNQLMSSSRKFWPPGEPLFPQEKTKESGATSERSRDRGSNTRWRAHLVDTIETMNSRRVVSVSQLSLKTIGTAQQADKHKVDDMYLKKLALRNDRPTSGAVSRNQPMEVEYQQHRAKPPPVQSQDRDLNSDGANSIAMAAGESDLDVAATGMAAGETGSSGRLRSQCPDVLTSMTDGTWRPMVMTEQQTRDIETFYHDVRKFQSLPVTLQRSDGKCGNIPFPPPRQRWRAMCDAHGPTPCCDGRHCQNRTIAQCTCVGCTDLRTFLHPEYATWVTKDARCQPKELSVMDMCDLLDGYTVAFVGDSLIRHLYIAFLMVLSNDLEYGALAPNSGEDVRSQCHGSYMFPKHCNCTGKIALNASFCGGRVHTRFISYYHPHGDSSPSQMASEVLALQELNKSFAVIGFGSHYRIKSEVVKKVALLPLLRKLARSRAPGKPKLLWSEMHAPSFLKSPVYAKQSEMFVKRFNSDIRATLREWRVPFFDTWKLTSQKLMTYDGTHFGLGVNMMKIFILLNYFLELRQKGEW